MGSASSPAVAACYADATRGSMHCCWLMLLAYLATCIQSCLPSCSQWLRALSAVACSIECIPFVRGSRFPYVHCVPCCTAHPPLFAVSACNDPHMGTHWLT
eukprot:1146856-Pelagomonas_calceolata.AAC.17